METLSTFVILILLADNTKVQSPEKHWTAGI